MLQMMRTGVKSPIAKFILFGLMTMAVAGLVLMDVQGVFRKGVTRNDVATIGDTKITRAEFDQSVRKTLQRLRMSADDAYKNGRIEQMLMQEIQMRLMRKEASRLGLYVDDKVVAKELNSLLARVTKDTPLTKREALQQILRNENMNEPQMVGSIKTQLASGLLLDSLLTGVTAPRQLVEDFGRFQKEQRNGSFVSITAEVAGTPAPADDEELKQYYEQIAPIRFAVPEYRTLDVIVLGPSIVSDQIELSEEDLKAAYDERLDEFQIPAQWSLAQTLVSDAATAQKIAELAQGGMSLKAATKKVMGDEFSYIEPEDFTEDALLEEIRDTVLALKVNQVSDPVESPLGWHVFKLDNKVDAITKSFASVKESLRKEIIAERTADSLYELANEFDDMIAAGMTVSEAAQEMGLTPKKLGPIAKNKTGTDGKELETDIPQLDDLLTEAFELGVGETTMRIDTQDNGYVLATVTDITPATVRSFNDVRDQVLKLWIAREQRSLLSKKAGEIINRVKSGESLADIAKELGLKLQKVKKLNRSAITDDSLPSGLDRSLFSIKKIGDVETLVSEDGVAVVQLDAIHIRTLDEDSDDMKTLTEITKRLYKQELMEQFRIGLYDLYDVDINHAAIDQMYGNMDN